MGSDSEKKDKKSSKRSAAPRASHELDYKEIVSDYLYRFQAVLPVNFGCTISDAQDAIAETLALHDTEGGGPADEEYNEEVRLQKQSFRILKQRADQERLESLRFAEETRLRQREFDYYRRKEAADKQKTEFDKLCNQSFCFVSNEQWGEARNETCCFGKECVLCSKVNCNQLEVLAPSIPAPCVVPSTVNDLWDSFCDDPDPETAGPTTGARSRRSKRNGGKAKQALLMLNEMQQTLRFIDERNKRATKWQAN
jgi:hypothetical protein